MPNAGKDRFKPEPRTYDALINWQRRLERETPFYRRLFEQVGVERVLDVACGTGRHARMFHSWGLTVEGADVSPEMLAHCRDQTEKSDTLRWVERSFDQPAPAGAPFDAAICVGNSLAIAPDLKAVGEVLRAMTASVRPGGALVIQVLNLWRIAEGSITWQKCGRIQDDDGDRIFLKGIHR
ncbi:MAG: class I SAM-dependent methyltransferase, partial [Planctomycetes bacterium]|nr:class I SAM-dependent methyltransferase [Planctomycetota bacterium]